MGLLDDYSSGVGSPRPQWPHQNVIRRAIYQTYAELEEQGLFMQSESTVTDDWDDLAPDLVVFDAYYSPLSIIEITTHKECRQIIRKCDELIVRFPDAEYFVYDYERGVLYGFDTLSKSWLSSEEYELTSRYLSRPLINYLV